MQEQLAAERARTDALLRRGKPWPLRDVLMSLRKATEHLMHDHACDAHWYECVMAANAEVPVLISALDTILFERACDPR